MCLLTLFLFPLVNPVLSLSFKDTETMDNTEAFTKINSREKAVGTQIRVLFSGILNEKKSLHSDCLIRKILRYSCLAYA